MPLPPSPQTCFLSTVPNVSAKSDRLQETGVEEFSNLPEIGCREAPQAGLEDGHLSTNYWKPQTDIFARFS